MTDPTLFDMLHGENLKKKKELPEPASSEATSSLDKFLEKNIEEYVDGVMEEEDPNCSKLLSQSARRRKIEKEIRETLDSSETGGLIVSAMKILLRDGHSYLSNENYQTLISEIEKLQARIDVLEFEQLNDESFKAIFSLSESSCDHIFQIGISKFNEGLLPDSLALFTFLSNLKSEDADYNYRLGIIAQKNERFDLALKAYTIASTLDPNFLAPRLFAVQCYLSCNQMKRAVQTLEEAQEIIKMTKVDQELLELFKKIEHKMIQLKPKKEGKL